jgi:DNA-binding NtrC family response regulator
MLKLLAVDGDPAVIGHIQTLLATEKVEITTADNAEAGLELFRQIHPRIALLGTDLPDSSGLDVLEKMLAADPGTDVILVASDYSTDSAVAAIQKGACDYMTKPLDAEKLRQRVGGLVTQAQERHRVLELERELVDAFQFEGIIGRSSAILQLFAKVRRVAPHFRTVLVTGATGTGKELVAKALHRLSPVASGPMAVCNCSALVETLLESELFGHVRGAFTGATQDKVGVFEYANGGTVFLDEIGELPLSAQVKILRVLQNHEVQRVGSPATRAVEVRVVAATHRNLRNLVAQGSFREDLYYRLSMVEIELPRLADRKEDLPLLQRHFVSKFAALYKKDVTGITRRAQSLLARYSWPGNVRELENVIGNACMMAQGNVIDVLDLPESVRDEAASVTAGDPGLIPLQELERRHLLYVLSRVGGSKTRAAQVLGVSRATVYEMLAKMKAAKSATDGAEAEAKAAGQ